MHGRSPAQTALLSEQHKEDPRPECWRGKLQREESERSLAVLMLKDLNFKNKVKSVPHAMETDSGGEQKNLTGFGSAQVPEE